MKYISFLGEVTAEDALKVGGKAFALSRMIQAGINVPDAFVITTDAFTAFSATKVSEEFLYELTAAFSQLGAKRVAVRSSATSEDSAEQSWAGQLDTFLNTTSENLIENVKKCWASLTSQRAQKYGEQNAVTNVGTAVIVQKMIDSDVSGVMFTVNPISKKTQEIMIEAVYGLGELLVQGQVTPANFVIEKTSWKVISSDVGDQDIFLSYVDGKMRERELNETQKRVQVLNEADIRTLTKVAKNIEHFFEAPQDIEWAKKANEFFVLQSRAITTLS